MVVEDEEDIRVLLSSLLARDGFTVLTAADGLVGLDLARKGRPDLILLDLQLPGLPGLDLARTLQQDRENKTPIVMLTARGEESDIVLGLELGADDYITKPFSPKELLARVRAVLRRAQEAPAQNGKVERRKLGPLSIDKERYEVKSDDDLLDLTRAEFRLLWTLTGRPGRVYTRGELADRITAGESIILERNVDVHVSALRRKLGEAGVWIETVRGVGYRFRDGH